MGLIRNITVLLLAVASLSAFARGVLSDSADFWSKDKDDGKRAKSVLEKGYAPPEKIKDKKSAGADDADLLLGLMADVVKAEAAASTNAPPIRTKASSDGMTVKSEEPTIVAQPTVVEKIVEVEVEKPVTNVVEKIVEKPVEVEKIITVEKQVTNTVEVVKVEKVEVEKSVTNVVEKIVEVEKPVVVERPVTNVIEKIVEKPVEVEKVVTVERPVTNTVEVVRVEKVEIERPVTNVIEKIVEKPVEVEKVVTVEKQITNTVEVVKVEKIEVEKPVTNIVEKIVEVEKPVEKIVERHFTNVVEKIVEVEKPVIVERQVTNVVEKVVYDHSVEMRLAKDKADLERRGGVLEEEKAGLEKRNDELKRELEEERRRRERLERANPAAGKKAKTGRPARITSTSTQYDRKKGVAFFEGNVHVDDESYQLHADKAFVFTGGTNDVRRIVAIGHVAMTNEMRRAYGGKVSYYRQDGMVVLYAGDGANAEILDESKSEDQTIRGSKIKFWIGSEQVEVLDATISAPNADTGFNVLQN